jgi:hypothetical protein
MRSLTKSPVAFARTALATARAELPAYSHPKSPHKFTQPQLVAMLALKDFLRTDYRGVIAYLSDWTDLRRALELTRLPNYSTLCYAQKRLLKKRAPQN